MSLYVPNRAVATLAAAAGLAASSAITHATDWAAVVDGNWNLAANWNPADVPDAAGESANLGLAGAYIVTLDISTTIDDLTVLNADAILAMPGSRSLTLLGTTLTNDGLIQVNSSGSGFGTTLGIGGLGTALSGGGEIWLQATGSRASIGSTGSLIQGASHTIRGSGQILTAMTNNGEVWGDVGVSLAGNDLDLTTNAKINNNLMGAAAGSLLDISVMVDQTGGGTLRALDTGSVRLSGADIVGGTLETVGTGTIETAASSVLSSGVTNTGSLVVNNAQTLSVQGGLTNDGVLGVNPIGGGFATTMRFLDTAVIAGTGEIQLHAADTRSRITGDAGVVVTHAAAHLIHGVGQIDAEMINDGIIRADVALSLVGAELDLETNDKINNNLMTAEAGSFLDLQSVQVDQSSGGTLRANDGGTVRFHGGSEVVGGTLDAPGTGVFETAGSSTLSGGVVTNGSLLVNNSITLGVAGGLTNTGTIDINPIGGGFATRMHFLDSAAIAGAGEIRLHAADTRSRISGEPGVVVTHDAAHLIHGVGQIDAEMINDGIIRADVALSSLAGDELDLEANDKVNNNLMTAELDSFLDITGITVTQTGGGIIRALDGGVVRLIAGAPSVVDGTIETLGTGRYEIASSGTFDGLTLDGNGQVNGSITLTIATGATNNGVMQINPGGSGFATSLSMGAGTLLDGIGEIQLRAAGTRAQIKDGPFIHAAGHLIRGAGQINAEMTNNGEVRTDATLSLAGGSIVLAGGPKTNNSLMVSVDTPLDLASVSVTQSLLGVLRALDTGTIRTSGSGTVLSGGSIETVGNGLYEIAGSATFDNVALSGNGQVNGSLTLSITGGVTNNGLMVVNPGGSGFATHLRFDESGTLAGTGEVNLGTAGGTAQVSGLDNTIIVTNGLAHTISGDGQLSVDLVNKGTIAPSDSPLDNTGTMNNIADLVFDASGTLDIQIGGPATAQYDRITQNAAATATLGGTVDFTFIDGYVPGFGDTWTFIDGGTVIGEFDTALIPPPPGLWQLKLIYESDKVFLVLTCPQDLNGDTIVNLDDVLFFIDAFMALDPAADVNGDGFINLADVLFFIDLFTEPCGP